MWLNSTELWELVHDAGNPAQEVLKHAAKKL